MPSDGKLKQIERWYFSFVFEVIWTIYSFPDVHDDLVSISSDIKGMYFHFPLIRVLAHNMACHYLKQNVWKRNKTSRQPTHIDC